MILQQIHGEHAAEKQKNIQNNHGETEAYTTEFHQEP
jgi:hypothetical protein